MLAPVTLFVYNRPDHTRKTVEALLENDFASETDLIVFSDAARTAINEVSVAQVRQYVNNICGFKSVTIYNRSHNHGLARSIVSGVSTVLEKHDRVIVLEDDMVTSPYFLAYMNEGLDQYSEDERVISIHGYIYPVNRSLPEAFFLQGADCWGWATWRRGWSLFNPDGRQLLDELRRRKLTKSFDFNGAYKFTQMLEDQTQGKNDSWAVRWYASAFLAGKLTLYPGRSLVHNFGNDSSGTHCVTSDVLDAELSVTPIVFDKVPVEDTPEARMIIQDYFRASRKRLSLKRVLKRCTPRNSRSRLVSLAKDCLPPFLARQLGRAFLSKRGGTTFDGPFSTWEQASKHSSGYDSTLILEKVLSATLKVKRGEAVYERDSVLFDEIQYAWPVTAGLLWAAARDNGRLSVLDFGGSLGSSFFQNRNFLEGLQNVSWSIVEQPHFVSMGREYIHDERLFFYSKIADCVTVQNPNVVLFSSVLQYVEDPYAVLDELVQSDIDIILIDRTSFHDNSEDMVLVQQVGKSIYPASYPLWVFSKNKFINYLSHAFDIITHQVSPEGFVNYSNGVFSFDTFLLQRRKP